MLYLHTMRFADIIGNSNAVDALRRLVDSDKIPHALLLSGPSGVGKMMLARAFVAYLNCENRTPDGDACGKCPACRQIAADNFPDLHYIYPIAANKSGGKLLSTDYAKEWKRFLSESPYMDYPYWVLLMNSGTTQPIINRYEADDMLIKASLSNYSSRFKVFLIWLPEKMNVQAANRLLKVIEEPHEDTIFLCVSNDPASILPTIFSRLQRISLYRPSDVEIADFLKKRGVSEHNSEICATLAEGSLLKALQLASEEGEMSEFSEIFRNIMRTAFSRKVSELKGWSDKLADMGREKSQRLLDYFARMIRENFIANLCLPPLNVMTPDEVTFSSKFAPFINVANVEEMLADIDAAKRDISRNANSKLVWFDYLIHLMILIRKKPK